METYTLDTVIMGSKKLYNKIKLMVNIAYQILIIVKAYAVIHGLMIKIVIKCINKTNFV